MELAHQLNEMLFNEFGNILILFFFVKSDFLGFTTNLMEETAVLDCKKTSSHKNNVMLLHLKNIQE